MSPTTTPTDLVGDAVYARLTGDSTLTGELGHTASDERIIYGHPTNVLGEEKEQPAAGEFPLLTYFSPTGRDVVPGFGDIRIQFDIWVWPTGADGGIGKLEAIDGALYDLLPHQAWTYNNLRFSGGVTSPRESPRERWGLLHRIRDVMIGVNN